MCWCMIVSAAHLELQATINGRSFTTAKSKATDNVAHWNEHFLFPIDGASTSAVDFSLFDVRAKPRCIGRYDCALSAFVLSDSSAPTVRCKLSVTDVSAAARVIGILHCGVRWQSISRHVIAPHIAATNYPTTYSGVTESPPSAPLPLPMPAQPQSPPPPYDESLPAVIISASLTDRTPFSPSPRRIGLDAATDCRHCRNGLSDAFIHGVSRFRVRVHGRRHHPRRITQSGGAGNIDADASDAAYHPPRAL